MSFSRRKFLLAAASALAAPAALAKPAKKKASLRKKGVAKTKAKKAAVKPIPALKRGPLQADHDFMPDIQAAWKVLEKREAGHMGLGSVILSYHWLLAVKPLSGGGIEVVRISERYRSEDPKFVISAPADNGINTRFKVEKPEGYVVLAQKRVVHDRSKLTEATYTAYSPLLDTASMIRQGLEYLEDLIDTASASLQTGSVPSLAFPDRSVAEVIPHKTALVLFITEHIDPLHARFVGVQQCADEVLITLAANGGSAYQYAVSSAGARGLPQFMRRTYDQVKSLYPKAGLVPDFIEGMKDHGNAAKSALLHFDMELLALAQADREFFTSPKNYRIFTEFLAAGYNWNAERVARVYQKTKRLSKGLPVETQLYVDIQRQVADYIGLPV